MKLSVTKKISIEQLPKEVRVWFSQVAAPLNNALDQFVRALTSQLTLSDNIKCAIFRVTLEAAQSYPLRLAYTLNERPTEVRVGQILPQDGSVAPAYGFRWELINNELHITFSGLNAVKHSLTLIAQV